MEKKIERVPYISKWYKEEQKNELLDFAFDEQNASSNFDVDKFSFYDKNLYTYSTNTTNGLWTTGYSKPIVQLKYVCNLTQEELTELSIYLLEIRSMAEDIRAFPKRKDFEAYCKRIANDAMEVRKYLFNEDNVRDKAQEYKLKILEEQSKPKKSYEGTLAEHWKELIDLFTIKEVFGLRGIKDFYEEYSLALKTNAIYSPELKNVHESYRKALFDLMNIANSLGIEFIDDFVKACEKCEE